MPSTETQLINLTIFIINFGLLFYNADYLFNSYMYF